MFQEVIHEFESGDIISWEFKTKAYDIGFALNYIDTSSDDKKEIVAMERHEAFKRVSFRLVLGLNLQVIVGSHEVQESGRYQFLWDNSFSWTRSKAVKYNVYKGTEVL